MKNIELLSGDVLREKVKAKNFPYVAFSPKENTVYYTSAPEPDQIIYTTISGTSIAPNWFRCDLVEMSNTYNDTKTAGCVLFEAPITTVNSLQNNSYLTSVIIPEGVEAIEEGTFYNCSNLSKVILPKSIKHIGSMAFCGTKLIPEIWYQENTPIYVSNWLLPSVEQNSYNYNADVYTVKYGTVGIGTNTFQNANVKKIYLPDTVKVIGDHAFYLSGINEICLSSALEVIGELAFSWCSSLTSITIPSSVTTIGKNAFYGCSSLASLVILEGVESIGESAFSACRKLPSIIIPSSVTTIGKNAFSYCDSLTSIVIPDSVMSIGERAFCCCESLTSMVVAEGNTVYDSREQCNAIIHTATNTLISGCQNTIIPESVTSIGDEAFSSCASLTSIDIPNSITSIGGYAFRSCSGLTSITIPDSVTSIGDYAFSGCSGLTSVTIPNSVTSIGSYAFNGCSLDSMYFQSYTPPTTMENALAGSTIAVIYVPHNSLEEYKASPLLTNHISKVVSGYVPETCSSLTATASDVQYGQITTTTISWEAVTSGHDRCTGELLENIIITGTSISDEFELNLSETDSIERTIPFTHLEMTVECTFTQGPFRPKSYTIDLNDSWELQPTNSNPNIEEYDGVYQSFSNKGKNNTAAIMYLDLFGYNVFNIYIRSNGESKYDYIMVGQPNTTITNDTSYSDTSLVKAHTRGKSTSSTALSNYTKVTFTGLDSYTIYRIPILYRKNSSNNSGDDRGYLLIPKNL